MTPPIAPWLRQHLQDTGRWNGDHIGRRARLATHECGQPVLTGLNDDNCAWPTTVDPHPLTPTGEMLALLGGRHTYDYWIHAQELNGPRDHLRIPYRPATDTGSTRVLAAHICGTPPLPHYPSPPPTPNQETNDDPPF